MRRRHALAPVLLALAGCAGTGVSLFPGEIDPLTGKPNPTGGVAVLDPAGGSDVAFIDQGRSCRLARRRCVD